MTAAPEPNITADTIAHLADTVRAPDLEALVRRHDYGLLVAAERSDGRVVQQVFMTLASAESKVIRTRARGLSARVVLVRLLPVREVGLDGGDPS